MLQPRQGRGRWEVESGRGLKKMRMRCKKMNDMIYDKEMIALKHCKKMNDMIYDKEMIALKHCKKMTWKKIT